MNSRAIGYIISKYHHQVPYEFWKFVATHGPNAERNEQIRCNLERNEALIAEMRAKYGHVA